MKDPKRDSMGFKLTVMEELRDGKWKTVAEAGEVYGVTPTAIRYWMNRMGFEYLKGRIIYVKTASEVDEIKRLKAELRKAKECSPTRSFPTKSTRSRFASSARNTTRPLMRF